MAAYLTSTNLVDVAVPSAVAYGYYNLDAQRSLAIGGGYLAGRLVGNYMSAGALAKYGLTVASDTVSGTALPSAPLASWYPAIGGFAGAALAGMYLDGIDSKEAMLCGLAGALVQMAVNRM